jgi:hypothetical protein
MPTIRSFAFPFIQGDLAFPKEITDFDVIKASIIQIITTAKGERVMRPDFGCSAFDFVFESDSDIFRLMVEREVRIALSRWESRIQVDSIEITADEITEPGQILITINYTIIATNEQDTVTIAGGGEAI